MEIADPETLVDRCVGGVWVLSKGASDGGVALAAQDIVMTRVIISYVQDIGDSLALTLQLRISGDFAQPGDIRQFEWAIAVEVANTDFLAGRDDLSHRARVELVGFVGAVVVGTGFEGVRFKSRVPFQCIEAVGGAPFVGSVNQGDTT